MMTSVEQLVDILERCQEILLHASVNTDDRHNTDMNTDDICLANQMIIKDKTYNEIS